MPVAIQRSLAVDHRKGFAIRPDIVAHRPDPEIAGRIAASVIEPHLRPSGKGWRQILARAGLRIEQDQL